MTTTLTQRANGYYSNLDAGLTPFNKSEWLQISLQIRKYHELTHFLCKKKYARYQNTLLDEIFADCMGLIFATGEYNCFLAKQFLGIEKESYQKGMRLENYIAEAKVCKHLVEKIQQFISKLKSMTVQISFDKKYFEDCIDYSYFKATCIYEDIFQ